MPSTAVWPWSSQDRLRAALSLTLLLSFFALGLAALGGFLSFVSPSPAIATPVEHLYLNPYTYAYDTPVYFAQGDFWLVRRPATTFGQPDRYFALYNEDPRRDVGLPCTDPWRPDFSFENPATGVRSLGWFRSGCHGQTYDLEGHCVFGPCIRDMDRYSVTLGSGWLVVNISQGALSKTQKPRH